MVSRPWLKILSAVWRAVAGQKAKPPSSPRVVLHDPGAERPHDLDDPFHDQEVQARMGKAISTAARKKT
jgi:hypothetical protein